MISILASALAAEPGSRATLLYANRDAGSAMFADELAMLTRQFEGRLEVVHYHSRAEARAGGPTAGEHEDVVSARLDADRLRHHLRDPRLRSAEWFLCGPSALLDDVESVLDDHEVPTDQVHRELFVAPDDDLDEDDLADVVPATVTVTSGGEQTVVRSEGTASLLETVLDGGVDVPYLCTGGICGTCRATVTHGTVHMQQNYALSDDEVARRRRADLPVAPHQPRGGGRLRPVTAKGRAGAPGKPLRTRSRFGNSSARLESSEPSTARNVFHMRRSGRPGAG